MDDGYQRVLVKGGNAKKDGYDVLYMKEMAEELLKWVEFCTKMDFL